MTVCVGSECRGWGEGIASCEREPALVGTFIVAWAAERVACAQLNVVSKWLYCFIPWIRQQDNNKQTETS